MSPQLLSQVKNPGDAIFGAIALEMRPALVGLAMQVIGQSAYLEASVAAMVALFLKADFRVVVEMFNAVVSSEAQLDVVEAAGRVALESKDDRDLFMAVMSVVRRARKRRRKYAHSLFGFATNIPDAVLIAPLESLSRDVAGVKASSDPFAWGKELTARALVFKDEDIISDIDAVGEAVTFVSRFEMTLGTLPRHDEARRELLAEPSIQRALAQLNRRSGPESPLQSP